MSHEMGKRVERSATVEEKERHRLIRQQVETELSELKEWARTVAARHKEKTAVGTVFTAEETQVVKAIDEYAAKHSLRDRSAVVREALAHLLGIEVVR